PHAHANPTRRRLLASLGGAALATGGVVQAQPAFPSRPIRVIVPYGTGGGTDILIRMLAPAVGASLGQSIVIENRPGAGSVLGTEMVARSPADGYTLLAVDSAILTNPGLRKLPFDTKRDLAGVTMMATAPVILVVHPSVPAKTLPELIDLARSKPGMLNYASGGNGASTHLAGELMKIACGVDIAHIAYKGTGPAMTDLLAGHVQMQFAGISSVRAHVEAGKLRAVAVTGPKRNVAMSAVPTFIEQGVKGVDADTWWGLYAPGGTPADLVGVLNDHFVRALKSADLAPKLAASGFIPVAGTATEHAEMTSSMIDRWTEVIKAAKITAD
ncbi:MAG: tripartite tricarboxylate transporter substrate binding protein, partial [Betaproteobacteria bacterium]|nr:tripartite tricarboxylate transporter substrate binding protein [Betaproteobacteria bacterium]